MPRGPYTPRTLRRSGEPLHSGPQLKYPLTPLPPPTRLTLDIRHPEQLQDALATVCAVLGHWRGLTMVFDAAHSAYTLATLGSVIGTLQATMVRQDEHAHLKANTKFDLQHKLQALYATYEEQVRRLSDLLTPELLTRFEAANAYLHQMLPAIEPDPWDEEAEAQVSEPS